MPLLREPGQDVNEVHEVEDKPLKITPEEGDDAELDVIAISSDEEDCVDINIDGIREDDADPVVSDDESEENYAEEESSEEENDEDCGASSSKSRILWARPRDNVAELSDSEEDVDGNGPLRRVGNIPKHWYDHLEHIGYNVDGKAISKKVAADAIDRFLSSQSSSGR